MDSDVTPSPTSTGASTGSAAASPHTPSGRPLSAAPEPVAPTSARTVGCHAVDRRARSETSRSAAIVYCVRSFVPMLANAALASTQRAPRAAAGTSIITPAVARPWSAHSATNDSASSGVAIIGAMTHTSADSASAARATAVSWRSSTSGWRRAVRRPRTPSAGFGSASGVTNGSGLSAPASSVRTTTLRPANAASTSR